MARANEAGLRIEVPMGEYRLAQAPAILAITGLGSCVALTFYAALSRRGGLAHIVLPAGPAEASPPARYVGAAISALLEEITRDGVKREEIEAKIIGGARILTLAEQWPRIGERNVATTIAELQRQGIAVVAQDIGGTSSRSLEFDLETGLVRVRTPEGTREL